MDRNASPSEAVGSSVGKPRTNGAASEKLLYHSSFLLIAYSHIIMISPLDALADIRPTPWQTPHPEEKPA